MSSNDVTMVMPAEKPVNHVYTAMIGDKQITIETGRLARLAGGAVTVRIGETIALATATMSKEVRTGIDFFPLSVEYEERLYAAGRIPGSFFRREGRPAEAGILICRLVDRPLRPLFPDDLRNDVQIIITAVSHDQINDIDVMAVNAASAALIVSDVPFTTPVGAARIGLIGGEFVINPTIPEMEYSDLDLRIAGTRDAIVMVECGSNEVDEETMVKALRLGHESIQDYIALQERMRAEIGKTKSDYKKFGTNKEFNQQVRDRLGTRVQNVIDTTLDKTERSTFLDTIEGEVVAQMQAIGDVDADELHQVMKDVTSEAVRERILRDGVRPDGRTPHQIRPIWCEAGDHLSPRAHGAGLFTRGETQVMSIVTLGSKGDAQKLDGLFPNEEKRYMHNYNFPPYSTGEAKVLRGSSRREVGHGALAERALVAVIPDEDAFPYTIRVVSEVLSSNGSTSMGSVCGSTLALMDAGVPIKTPIGGIACGLVVRSSCRACGFEGVFLRRCEKCESTDVDANYVVLTDIAGIEDHLGDMDFKVTGSKEGITAIQMDLKIKEGITPEVLEEALAQSKRGRLHVIGKMVEVMPEPRTELSEYAPRIFTVQINPDKIGALIGKGGETIRGLVDEFDASIDVEEDGTVFICARDGASGEALIKRINELTKDVEAGDVFVGKVVKTTDFGAFVELKRGTDGLVHISNLAEGRVNKVEDVVKRGQMVQVEVIEVKEDRGKQRIGLRVVDLNPKL